MTAPSGGQIFRRFVDGSHVPACARSRQPAGASLGQSGLVRIASPTSCNAGGYAPGRPLGLHGTLKARGRCLLVAPERVRKLDPRGS